MVELTNLIWREGYRGAYDWDCGWGARPDQCRLQPSGRYVLLSLHRVYFNDLLAWW
eukprot:COSAG05_NODE_8143_length_732_cov_0.974724_1_plen_55_part_10